MHVLSVAMSQSSHNAVFLFPPDEATTLFRATTLASTLMEQYMKATATPFVHHALKDTILRIMESKQSCEVRLCSPWQPAFPSSL